ncbi:MAG: hypothetical protein A2Y62_21375 [Candidatus Fischerbacteria bacterium RBG_13_37_8]|uniref:Uroporphyrinogen-III synthase n=1 Tax=Candidatus Fischerbacteria bacterium RBG_13_37_8 TaxID=1817863 RepID=A0A1F5VTJ6_9BACT|nr:MAG: hypothetical protein A2Y62_21375 [Candidatus Fischerbacteria bacterium RBG_13_37_8]
MKPIIVITRQKEEGAKLAKALGEDFECIMIPSIQIIEPESWEACDAELKQLNTYDVIIFTSVHAVHYFMKRAKENGKFEQVQLLKAYVVGEKTKDALLAAGIESESLPDKSSSEGLARHILQTEKGIKRMLFPKGELADDRIEKRLQENGIEVKAVVVYRNVKATITEKEKAALKEKFQNDTIKIVTFFSPSAVKNFFEETGWIMSCEKVFFAAIGPTTKKALTLRGVAASIVPSRATAVALAEAIKEFKVSSW